MERLVAIDQNYTPHNAKMILARVDRQNKRFPLEFIRGKHTADDCQLSLEADLIPGEYYLFVELDLPSNPLFEEFTMTSYSKSEIVLEQCSYPQFLEKALSSCAMQKSRKSYYYDHNESEVFRCFSMTDSLAEYGYIFYYNGSDEGVLEEKINFSEIVNLEPMAPYNQNDIKIKVSPGKHKIIILKRLERKIRYSVNYKSRFSFGEKQYLEEIYEKGKKIQVTHNNINYEIWIYTMYGGSDFYFVMENKTEKDLCKAKFKLDLRNMHDNDNPTTKEWTLTLEPGCKIVKKLSTTDSSQKSGVKYSYAFRVEQLVTDETQLISKVKEKGKKKKIDYQGESYEIYFYSCFY